MIPITALKDKTVALFGLGGSGIATAKAILAGGALNQRKPSPAPITVATSTVSSPVPGTKLICR